MDLPGLALGRQGKMGTLASEEEDEPVDGARLWEGPDGSRFPETGRFAWRALFVLMVGRQRAKIT